MVTSISNQGLMLMLAPVSFMYVMCESDENISFLSRISLQGPDRSVFSLIVSHWNLNLVLETELWFRFRFGFAELFIL